MGPLGGWHQNLGGQHTLFCPAFPRHTVTMFQGMMFIGSTPLGESFKKADPVTPMTNSNLVEVLQAQSTQKVGLLSHGLLVQGKAAIEALRIVIPVKSGEEGRLFGSVGAADIADAASATGTPVDKKEVRLPQGPLRLIGEYDIEVHLHTGVDIVMRLAGIGQAQIANNCAISIEVDHRTLATGIYRDLALTIQCNGLLDGHRPGISTWLGRQGFTILCSVDKFLQ